ncbi:MAG: hypothetical protein ACRD1R_05550 [Acidobacteriota bacterium]
MPNSSVKKIPIVAVVSALLMTACASSESEDTSFQFRVSNFSQLKEKLSTLDRDDYELQSIEDDGGVLRVDVLLKQPPSDEEHLRKCTLAVLEEVQEVIGNETTVSVWTSTYDPSGRIRPAGMAYYSSRIGNYNFKTAAEIQQ